MKNLWFKIRHLVRYSIGFCQGFCVALYMYIKYKRKARTIWESSETYEEYLNRVAQFMNEEVGQ